MNCPSRFLRVLNGGAFPVPIPHSLLDFHLPTHILFPMRIHFFGATRTTTGSMYLLEISGNG